MSIGLIVIIGQQIVMFFIIQIYNFPMAVQEIRKYYKIPEEKRNERKEKEEDHLIFSSKNLLT